MSEYNLKFVVKKKAKTVLRASLYQGQVDAQDEPRITGAFASIVIPENKKGDLAATLNVTRNRKTVKALKRNVKLGLAEALQAERHLLAMARDLLNGTAKKHGL